MPGASSGTTYATSRAAAPAPSTATAAARTPGWEPSTASTSPGSTRNPRTFTWLSARPRYSSTPSARHRATSPDRYNRDPSPANRSATNRSAVSAPRPRYPRATPAPPIHNSPATPAGTGSRCRSSTHTRALAIGRPAGTDPATSCPEATSNTQQPTTVSVGPYSLTTTDPGATPSHDAT